MKFFERWLKWVLQVVGGKEVKLVEIKKDNLISEMQSVWLDSSELSQHILRKSQIKSLPQVGFMFKQKLELVKSSFGFYLLQFEPFIELVAKGFS